MKRLSKVLITSILFIIGMCCVGCGSVPSVEGDDLVNKAKEDYVALDSAKVIMTNMETNEVEQTFVFKYDEKDVLTYSYEGKSGDAVVAQFNNGIESYTYQDGEVSHSYTGEKDFQSYNRDATYPQADKGLIAMTPSAITEATQTTENGVTKVTHIYDVEKIGATVENGAVKTFEIEFWFDDNEKLMYFTETTTADVDGAEKTYAYKVEITEKNAVEKVENVVSKYESDK